MKQILQDLRSGETLLSDVPAPACNRRQLLVRTTQSLISAGTERMLVEFGKGSLIAKAKSQPDKVKQVIDKMRTEGVMPTVEAVFKKLGEPLPLGYCNVGEVIDVGAGINDIKVGDRVASNGPHAEYVSVPRNLCARVPEGVSDEDASFTVLSAIALQGIRLAEPTLGENVVVFGAGLIGLVTIQLLRASGCNVLAIDINPKRLEVAEQFGATTCNAGEGDAVKCADAWTEGAGVDAVLITASAKTDELIHQAATMCRKRGRIVLVGVIGLNLRRSDFYEKELSFQVSCSYGPGRYDDDYEQKGIDYPRSYVRWTEQRNFDAVLNAMANGDLDVGSLVTDRLTLQEAPAAYDRITSDPHVLGVVLDYGTSKPPSHNVVNPHAPSRPASKCVALMLGAGNFAKMTMAPALTKSGARLKYISDIGNAPAAMHIANKYGFENATTDTDAALTDPEVNTVFIATGHSSHATLVRQALEAGKHVFVEKPLAMTVDQVKEIGMAASEHPDRQVMVGFNRRFSPYTVRLKELLAGRGEPLAMCFTCNAGIIPADVWVHDPEQGGGRIVGEACHFIDLLSFLCGSRIVSVSAVQMERGVAIKEDKMSIVMGFADGSVGTVNYFGNGHKGYPKETLEVYSEGRVFRLSNFRHLVAWGAKGFRSMKGRLDKGHAAQFKAFVERVEHGGDHLITFDELKNVALASFAAMTSAGETRTVLLDNEYAI